MQTYDETGRMGINLGVRKKVTLQAMSLLFLVIAAMVVSVGKNYRSKPQILVGGSFFVGQPLDDALERLKQLGSKGGPRPGVQSTYQFEDVAGHKLLVVVDSNTIDKLGGDVTELQVGRSELKRDEKLEDVLKALGKPQEQRSYTHSRENLGYPAIGLELTFREGLLQSFSVDPERQPPS